MVRVRASFAATAGVVALIWAAGPAWAQTPIGWNAEVRGTIAVGDEDGDDYRFDGRAGQRIEATMRSDDLDAYLRLYAGTANGEPIAADDDGLGEGTDSRLRFTLPSDGVYVLRASALSEDGSGAYRLRLTERAQPARAGRPVGLRLGDERTGRLDDRSPLDDTDRPFNAYEIRLRQGDRVVIEMVSDDGAIDPIVRIGRIRNSVFTALGENDDGAGRGLNSYLPFTAPETAAYVIQASQISDDEGAYRLSVRPAPQPGPARDITIGQTVTGRLGDETGMDAEGRRADGWRFVGQAGQRIAATLRSEAFDAYLDLIADPDGAAEVIGSDDDGAGSGTDARLVRVLPSDGVYQIQARGLLSEAAGDYELTLETVAPDPAPTPLAISTPTEGRIESGNPIDPDGRAFVDYGFRVEAGTRVQITLRSSDFDAFLQLFEAGSTDEPLASDDDGLGEGTDSLLNHTAVEGGDFVVRASPLSADQEGLFTIELRDLGPEPTAGSLIVGATARGVLSETAATDQSGVNYDAYRLTARAGEKIRLTMVSNAFDAVVQIGRGDGDDWVLLAEDDDGLSDTHARLDWTADEAGDYVVRARSFSAGQTGDYALRVEPRE